jgi:rhodanese-related sulfurtransferase
VNARPSLLAVLGRATAIACVGALVGLGLGALREGGLSLHATARVESCEAPVNEPRVLSPKDASQLCAEEGALIADARPAGEYASGHIAGAVHLPCDASGDVAGAALAHLGARASILVYGTATSDAVAVARAIARRAPAAKVAALAGGFSAWERAGLACASGPCDSCAASSHAE